MDYEGVYRRLVVAVASRGYIVRSVSRDTMLSIFKTSNNGREPENEKFLYGMMNPSPEMPVVLIGVAGEMAIKILSHEIGHVFIIAHELIPVDHGIDGEIINEIAAMHCEKLILKFVGIERKEIPSIEYYMQNTKLSDICSEPIDPEIIKYGIAVANAIMCIIEEFLIKDSKVFREMEKKLIEMGIDVDEVTMMP